MQEYAQEFAENIYFSPDELNYSIGMWPVRIGRNRAKPNYCAGPRTIEYYSVHFVHAGVVLFQFGEQSVQLRQGDLFCLFPRTSYSYRPACTDVTLEMAWIALDGPLSPALLALAGIREHTPWLRDAMSAEIESTLHQFWSVGALRPHDPRLAYASLLYKLFDGLKHRTEPAQPPKDRQKDWIKKSVDYMHTHYAEQIDATHVAMHAGIHRTYFSKIFAEQIGMSPAKYLMKLRMDKAMRLLQETPLTVTEIALSLSYSDAASFSRAFSSYYGFPPTHYRLKTDEAPPQ